MVDLARRKPTVLLSTYGEAVRGGRGCGGALPAVLQPASGRGAPPTTGQDQETPGRGAPPTTGQGHHQLFVDGRRAPEHSCTETGWAGRETGRAGPETGRVIPETGRAGPETGRAGPETGRSCPETGRRRQKQHRDAERHAAGVGGGVGTSWLEPLHDRSSDVPTRTDDHGRGRQAVTWQVAVRRGSRGLGLSLEPVPGRPAQVQIRRVFLHQPAAMTGQLRAGDRLISVNDLPVSGLSVQEVLHVLRLAGSEVLLSLTRPADSDSTESDSSNSAPEPTGSASRSSLRLPLDTESRGTFSVELRKVNNTLGLSLRRTDDTVLGHTIRAKVREPAASDSRVRVGDKLLQVDGVDTTAMSHAEVVSLLRRSPSRVTLTLYRDGMATPGSPGSPVSGRSTRLRPEAVEMLSGLALRREPEPGAGPGPGSEPDRRLSCTGRSSPRRRRRPPHTTDSSDPFSRLSVANDMDAVTSERLDQLTRLSESPALAEAGAVTSERQPQSEPISELSDDAESNERLMHGAESEGRLLHGAESNERLLHGAESEGRLLHGAESNERLLHGAESEERLLHGAESDEWHDDTGEDSDAELHERHLRRVAAGGERADPGRGRQPYLSVQPQQRVKSGRALKRISSEERLEEPPELGGQLGKWKGFTLDAGASDGVESECSGGETALRGQNLTILLRRGWSARLGFSLHSTDGSHVVSHIHPDSVAERDGRLRVGDVITKVNDVPLRGMTSEQVIDLLRKTKGAIGLCVVRL